jgi:hypothetical protein
MARAVVASGGSVRVCPAENLAPLPTLRLPLFECGAPNKPAQFPKYIEEILARFAPVTPAPDEPVLALLGVLE